MAREAALGPFNVLVVIVAGALGLGAGWFIGSYGSLALGWLVSLLVGSGDWLFTLALLGGLIGAAGGASLGVAASSRALRSAHARNGR